MTYLHIVAGLLALAAGALALCARKGSALHRQSGLFFVATMLLMSSSGALMAAIKPVRISVVAGVLAFYLVSTALLTVRRSVADSRGWMVGFMLMAFAVALYGLQLGVQGLNSPRGSVDGYPAVAYLLFSSVALIGAALDARLLLAREISPHHRLARHLWRMCFAMYLATSAFFLGQAKLLPEPMRNFALLAVPVVLVLLAMVYWLARVLWWQRRRVGVAL
jgi:uncharacterized membrane protein